MANVPLPDLSFAQILAYVRDITMVGALVFILYGGRQKWWVWGWQYEEEVKRTLEAKKDGRYWQDFSFSQLTANKEIAMRLPRPSQENTREGE